eukprot:jgi/Orpsp1_1/1176930/evm.model.c7180000059533.1
MNSPIDYCYFGNTPIAHYQQNSCKNIENNMYYHNDDNITSENKNIENNNNDNKNTKDCEHLNKFLNLPINTNCCDLKDIVTCDKNNNIEKLHLILDDNKKKIDLNKIPIFKKLNELEINSADIFTLPSILFDLPKLQILNINKSNITEISNNINPESPLEYINLSDNNIKNFPYQFEYLTNLKILNLINNNISEELHDSLINFSSLENLFIDNNYFYGELIIPKSVKKITANKNKFNSIYMNNSNNLLQSLELQGNLFNENIFNNLTQFKDLTYLDLSYNKKIRNIPTSIENLSKLENLNLRETNIKELPYSLFNLLNLKKLYLESSSELYKIINFKNSNVECFFEETPISCYQKGSCLNIDDELYNECTSNEIYNIKSQNSINNDYENNDISQDCKLFNIFAKKPLDSNCCEEFGISCDQEDSIIKLYLNNDEDSIIQYYIDINEIDFNDFPNLNKIKKLEISNIKLNSIPNIVFYLPNLKKLSLNKNDLIGELPKEFENFPSLEEINLNGNKLSGKLLIPKTVKEIYINNNMFNSLYETKINHSLQKLHLVGNEFNGDIFNILINFKELKELNLNNNQKIEYIPSSIEKLINLEILYLNGININKFPNELFSLPNLNTIEIDSNIDMNAKILPFKKSPDIMCSFGSINISCYQPGTCFNIAFNQYPDPCFDETETKDLNFNSNIYYNEPNGNNKVIHENSENENISITGISINGIDILTIIGIENTVDDINDSVINEDNNDSNNHLLNLNKSNNKNNTKDDGKSNKLKIKGKSKNQTSLKTNNDDLFIYIIITLLGINAVIIITLIIICLLSYKKTKRKNKVENVAEENADIIISEKYTIFTKEDLKSERTLLLNNSI